MSISNKVVNTGNQSLAIDNNGVVGLFSQEIAITEGNQYKLTANLYVEELTGKPGIWLRWIDEKVLLYQTLQSILMFLSSINGKP